MARVRISTEWLVLGQRCIAGPCGSAVLLVLVLALHCRGGCRVVELCVGARSGGVLCLREWLEIAAFV